MNDIWVTSMGPWKFSSAGKRILYNSCSLPKRKNSEVEEKNKKERRWLGIEKVNTDSKWWTWGKQEKFLYCTSCDAVSSKVYQTRNGFLIAWIVKHHLAFLWFYQGRKRRDIKLPLNFKLKKIYNVRREQYLRNKKFCRFAENVCRILSKRDSYNDQLKESSCIMFTGQMFFQNRSCFVERGPSW